ncbi:MAG: hypothetical protein K5663_06680 [Clostridiales bacterium]|nr:hypothetical protein [Clostridiales bacterium]
MKKLLSLLIVLALLGCAALAEPSVYSDDYYSFTYPGDWSLDTASNGDIVLLAPDGNSGMITFCVFQNYITLVGDPAQDSELIQNWMTTYSGPNLEMNGEYEFVRIAGLSGYRFYGTWKATGDAADCVLLTGDTHLVGFVMIGEDAFGVGEEVMASVVLKYDFLNGGASEGWLTWSNSIISVNYPDTFSLMDTGTGVLFSDPSVQNNAYAVTVYSIDFDYDDVYAPSFASQVLPKATGITAEAQTELIDGRVFGVIKGNTSGTDVALYLTGKGRTVVGVLFIGNGVTGMAEQVLGSLVIQ